MRSVRAVAPASLLSILLVACSGQPGPEGAVALSCAEGDPTLLCLASCNLGCTTTTCLRTDIAPNEILILQFTDDVDPRTVDTTTIRLRTAAGEEPVGEFFVNGNQVEFVPALQVAGGQVFFGFEPGETYTLTVPGNSAPRAAVVRSTSNRPFATTYSCTLIASQRVRDYNAAPPSVHLVSPTAAQADAVPVDAVLQLEFDEMVDPTPFQFGSPVTFAVQRTIELGGQRDCDPASSVPLPGSPRLDYDPARGTSVLTFRPSAPLPFNACIEIAATSMVVDLTGRPLAPITFTLRTATRALTELPIAEEFLDAEHLDREASGGTWGDGVARFAPIGGDARHGPFDLALATPVGVENGLATYEIDTDDTTIPAANTRTGAPMAVTDGRFWFERMFVPANVRVRFVGEHAAQITVAGSIDVLGELDVRGASLPYPSANAFAGQAGGRGGAGGGAGGRGGDRGTGAGVQPQNRGVDGGDARVPAGRAYATSAVGSGGRGSSVFPASGLSSALYFGATATLAVTPSAPAAGGGGSNYAAGGDGRVVWNSHPDPATSQPPRLDAMGPVATGGPAVRYAPFPPPTGSAASSLHFLVGGAGGGGAASGAVLALHLASPTWSIGGGGAGGGGALALRAGDALLLAATGAIRAAGGDTAGESANASGAVPVPGGAGAGGAVVLQSGRQAQIDGLVDVRGGTGGLFDRANSISGALPPLGARVQIRGGDGGAGSVRFELPLAPAPGQLTGMQPPATAANTGALVERDAASCCRSTWYSTGSAIGPEFMRYEIAARIDGVAVLFSDDPAVSAVAAGFGAPLRFEAQVAQLDLGTGAVTAERPWRQSVRSTAQVTGIASDAGNAVRFLLVADQTLAQEVVVERVRILYRR